MARKLRTGEVAEEDVFGPAVTEDELQEEGEKGESVESFLAKDGDDWDGDEFGEDDFEDCDIGDEEEAEEEEADADAEPVPEVSEEATPDPEPVAVAEPVAEIEWDEAKERKADEEAWLEELQKARKEMETAKSALDNLKERTKIAKANYNLAQETLVGLVEDGPNYRKKPERPVPAPTAKAAPAPTQSQPESDSDPKPEPIAEVDNWQSISTASLLEGIEGLGAKKRDTLIETFPTLGKLEEARAEASKEFLPFKAKLPKGIGEKIASDLEEKMLQAIAKRTN